MSHYKLYGFWFECEFGKCHKEKYHKMSWVRSSEERSKISKNLEVIFNSFKIITIFVLYRNTWKWHFRSKWRLLVKLFKHLSLILDHFRTLYRSQMSGKHAQNIWRTSRDVYSTKTFCFEKIYFFRFFKWFSSISPNFERASARANAPIGTWFSKSQNSGFQKCNALSPVFISLF